MPPVRDRRAAGIALRAPVLLLVLAATAIPIEWRGPGGVALGLDIGASDVVANVAGYLPVGAVLGDLGVLRAVGVAAAVSVLAEGSQFFMVHRDPSVIDVIANVLGAFIGVLFWTRLRLGSPVVHVNRWKGLVAGISALAVMLTVGAQSGMPLNARGAAEPGTLEAYWKFDEDHGRAALDSSGHGLQGRFSREPDRLPGVSGKSAGLDGARDYVRFGPASALRLTGNMTVSAWINSSSFPVDDAAVVSNHATGGPGDGAGFQLDTTVDRGPRTIGFKLMDSCGNLFARYGSTPLAAHTWYFVAGTYDAHARTLDVYLNGVVDNGPLVGQVTAVQRSSRLPTYVGRRGDRRGYEFAGSIDEVRVYSRALTPSEIAADMRADAPGQPTSEVGVPTGSDTSRQERPHPPCALSSDREDERIPMAAAGVGALLAVAAVGLWPTVGPLVGILFGLAGGLSLLPLVTPSLPPMNSWVIPLTSLAGALSVVVSSHQHGDSRR